MVNFVQDQVVKEKRYSSRPKTVYLRQEVNMSLQAISNFRWFMTGVNVPTPVTLKCATECNVRPSVNDSPTGFVIPLSSDSNHLVSLGKRNLEFRKKHLSSFKKELFSLLFKRESSCSDAFVASLNHSILLGRIFC